ncbi:MAG: molybdate transport system substrate-binding protein [Mycobacterium sp.]|jgi:molybdate transport system substrate-binding protein|nr:molybdate transport system substrate-binding protein [Mycobacterium sp.]
MKRVSTLFAAGLLAVGLLSGCGSSTDSSKSSSSGAPAMTGPSGASLMVFAAASLKQSFTQIGEQFKTDNPGAAVEFNFAGSSDLVTQLTQGATADVFASADTKNMDKAIQANLVAGTPVNFASNVLTIAVAPGNPKGIKTFQDLAQPGLNVVVCAPQVPCGSAATKIEQATGVKLAPVSEESSVTDVLGKVSTGQADAGLVYVTDVEGSGGKVTGIDFPESSQAVNTYPIAALKDSGNADLANKFVSYVTGEAGQKVLNQAGFSKP